MASSILCSSRKSGSIFHKVYRLSRLVTCRLQSSGVEVDHEGEIAIVKMNKEPVNSLNTPFLQELTAVFKDLAKNDKCRGAILTSGLPEIFSAGMDFKEWLNASEETAGGQWRSLLDLHSTLYSSPLVVMAAITGHSPAGGCFLSMSCDYRVMARGYTIGLNETKLGLPVPISFKNLLVQTIGNRNAELVIQLGELFPAEEAQKIGIIDETVSKEEVIPVTIKHMNKWLKIQDSSRQACKQSLRYDLMANLNARMEEEVKHFISIALHPLTQKMLVKYVESLKSKQAR